jgi:DNA (cytosine-5)-methyltransferase 1
MTKHGNLFTGIGIWDLAARNVGWRNVFQCEKDKKCLDLLSLHFPRTIRHTDIRETDFSPYKNKIDVLTLSDPCTSLSIAGRQGFETSADYLWPEANRAIREIKPGYIISENVCDRRYLDAERVFADLESEGYTVEPPLLIPALSQGARHERYRFFFVAYTNGKRWTDELYSYQPAQNYKGKYKWNDRQKPDPILQYHTCSGESALLRVADGNTKGLDVSWRVGAIGNALYYPIAYRLIEAVDWMIKCEKK